MACESILLLGSHLDSYIKFACIAVDDIDIVMSRPWRIEFEGALYHVLSRGNERQDIYFRVVSQTGRWQSCLSYRTRP